MQQTRKTSLVKRILAEVGAATDGDLSISGAPATDKATSYRYQGVELVDLPGFHSGRSGHDEEAHATVSGAALVLCLQKPNLMQADEGVLKAILAGHGDVRGKHAETIYLISRADELGVDPQQEPEQFQRLRERKERELRALLATWGLNGAKVHTIAPDPFGAVGDSDVHGVESYEQAYRAWDGVDSLLAALEQAHAQRDALTRVGVLDLTVDRLRAAADDVTTAGQKLEAEGDVESRIVETLAKAGEDGQRLKKSVAIEFNNVCRSHAERIADEVLKATKKELKDAADRAAIWWQDPEFQADVRLQLDKAQAQLDDWAEEFESQIGRINRAEYKRRRRTKGPKAGGEHISGAARGFRDVSDVLTKVFSSRDAVYKAGKSIGIKFKPWGATKAAAKMAKIGSVLAVVGVVLEVASLVAEIRADKKLQAARERLARDIEATVPEVEQRILYGTEEEPGPLRLLESSLEAMAELQRQASERLRALSVEQQRLVDAIIDIDRILACTAAPTLKEFVHGPRQ